MRLVACMSFQDPIARQVKARMDIAGPLLHHQPGGEQVLGVDTVAVFREKDGNWYLKLNNAQGNADHGIHFHSHEDVTLPVAGYFGAP